jgi:hypothetical protein
MADIKGYVNPRSLGNNEPQELLHMDIFFEQALWDRYIEDKDKERRDLYTWDATALATFSGLQRLSRENADEALRKGIGIFGKIGHHAPCHMRVYQHPDILALCVGLDKETRAVKVMKRLIDQGDEIGWTETSTDGNFTLTPAFYATAENVRDLFMDDKWMGEILAFEDESILVVHGGDCDGGELCEASTDEANLLEWLNQLEADGDIKTYELRPMEQVA